MSNNNTGRVRALHYGVSAGALALAMIAGSASAQTGAAADPAAQQATVEEVVVTGFRKSLDAALNVKRDSVSSVDVIVAEDIAKFPDQNLAESLQRVPGISIVRDGGEGRAITVRGLGSQFTRVRVNGMEAIATTSDGASANRERGSTSTSSPLNCSARWSCTRPPKPRWTKVLWARWLT
jgi:iron complex outermembrane recepter protein